MIKIKMIASVAAAIALACVPVSAFAQQKGKRAATPVATESSDYEFAWLRVVGEASNVAGSISKSKGSAAFSIPGAIIDIADEQREIDRVENELSRTRNPARRQALAAKIDEGRSKQFKSAFCAAPYAGAVCDGEKVIKGVGGLLNGEDPGKNLYEIAKGGVGIAGTFVPGDGLRIAGIGFAAVDLGVSVQEASSLSPSAGRVVTKVKFGPCEAFNQGC
jgi:hypothetical protein